MGHCAKTSEHFLNFLSQGCEHSTSVECLQQCEPPGRRGKCPPLQREVKQQTNTLSKIIQICKDIFPKWELSPKLRDQPDQKAVFLLYLAGWRTPAPHPWW